MFRQFLSRRVMTAASSAAAALGGAAYYRHLREHAALNRASINDKLSPESDVLTKSEFKWWKLVEGRYMAPNAKMFVFEPVADIESGITAAANVPLEIPPISCVLVRSQPESEEQPLIRPYNPVTPRFTNGSLALVIKHYPTGKMSAHMHDLRPGDFVQMKGPFEQYRASADEFAGREMAFVAGGTGITPCYQFIQEMAKRKREGQSKGLPRRMTVVFANNSEMEILLRQELDEMAAECGSDFLQVYYTTKEKPLVPEKNMYEGIVTRELLEKTLPPASRDPFVFVCGPPGMMQAVSGAKTKDKKQGELSGHLKELGYREGNVWKL